MKKLIRLVSDQRGATLLEYIILVGVIALLAIGAFRTFSDRLTAKITEQGDAVEGIPGSAQ